MVAKVDEYMDQLAALDARDAEPGAMSLSEELSRLEQLNALWDSMTDNERVVCLEALKRKRVPNAS